MKSQGRYKIKHYNKHGVEIDIAKTTVPDNHKVFDSIVDWLPRDDDSDGSEGSAENQINTEAIEELMT